MKIILSAFIALLLFLIFCTYQTAYQSFEENGKMGYINIFGKVTIPPTYEFAGPFGDGGFFKDLAVVGRGYSEGSVRYGCIDRWGRERLSCEFDFISKQTEEWVLVVGKDNENRLVCGFNDFNNSWPIPMQLASAEPFSEGLAAVKSPKEPWLWGYISKDFPKTGRMIIPFRFENATPFKNGKAIVRYKDSQLAEIDKTGRILSTFIEENENGNEFPGQ